MDAPLLLSRKRALNYVPNDDSYVNWSDSCRVSLATVEQDQTSLNDAPPESDHILQNFILEIQTSGE